MGKSDEIRKGVNTRVQTVFRVNGRFARKTDPNAKPFTITRTTAAPSADRKAAAAPRPSSGDTPPPSGDTPPPSGGSGSTPVENPENLIINQGARPAEMPPEENTIKPAAAEENSIADKIANAATVDELNELSQTHMLSVEELEGLKTRQKELEQISGLPENNGDTAATKISKEAEDPDEPEADDDKFDIQQGDFIEFLMKDIVLASAAWAGKKVSGYAGVLMYRGLSWAYHKYDDEIYKPTKEFVEDSWDKFTGKVKETLRTVDEYQIKDTLHREDETTGNAKKIIEIHNKDIADNQNLQNRTAAFERFAQAAFSGQELKTYKLEEGEVWFDPETRTKIPVDTEVMREILKKAAETRKFVEESDKSPQEKQEYLQTCAKELTLMTGEYTLLEAQKNIFTANMASAAMLQNLAENGAKEFNPQEYEALKKQLSISFFTEWRKIKSGTSEFESVEAFLAASDKANKKAYNNVEDGRYLERNKIPPTNDTLNRLINIDKPQSRQDTPESLITSAMQFSEHLESLNRRHQAASRTVDAANAAQNAHNRGRQTGGKSSPAPQKPTTFNEGGRQ